MLENIVHTETPVIKEDNAIRKGRSMKEKDPNKVLWELQNIRRRKGLTQHQLAESIGRSYYWYNKKENGDIAFTTEEILTVCETLDIPRENILDIFFKSVDKTN